MPSEHVVHPLKPIYDEASQILILGSFPSVKSRELHFYYANPHNRFWPVMARLFHEEITDRTAFCHGHHIAIWDVIHACTIQNSSDTSIKDVEVNAIGDLIQHTRIHTIFTTGRKAGQLYDKYIHLPLEHIELPSTSSANASKSLEDLVQSYSILLEKINEE